jgi:hypothetical protein
MESPASWTPVIPTQSIGLVSSLIYQLPSPRRFPFLDLSKEHSTPNHCLQRKKRPASSALTMRFEIAVIQRPGKHNPDEGIT